MLSVLVLALTALLVRGPGRRLRARAPARRLPVPAMSAAVLGVGVAVVMGGVPGLVLGAGAAVGSHVLLQRIARGEERGRMRALATQAPVVADLLAACLRSGATTVDALDAIAQAVASPARDELLGVVRRQRLGSDAREAWSHLGGEGPFALIAAAVVRASDSGAPLADLLSRAAEDLRRQRRASLMASARVVGVMAVLPLGLCFLPAFVLIGVVPVVASLVTSLVNAF